MRVLRSRLAGRDIRDHDTWIGLRDAGAAERFLDSLDRSVGRLVCGGTWIAPVRSGRRRLRVHPEAVIYI